MSFAKNMDLPAVSFDTNSELVITASPTSSKSDFDFLVGHHKVHHKKLKERLSNCTEWIEFEGTKETEKLLTGMANVESHYMKTGAKTVEGMALRLFSPATRLWSIYWADDAHGTLGVPVVGSFEADFGHFFTKDNFNNKDILIGFRWDIRDKDNPVWSQAFSEDNGTTWEWNWFMYMTKTKQIN